MGRKTGGFGEKVILIRVMNCKSGQLIMARAQIGKAGAGARAGAGAYGVDDSKTRARDGKARDGKK